MMKDFKQVLVKDLKSEVTMLGRVVTELMSSEDEMDEAAEIEQILSDVTRSSTMSSNSERRPSSAENNTASSGQLSDAIRRKRFARANFKKEHLEDM